jgi:hypothetical protein
MKQPVAQKQMVALNCALPAALLMEALLDGTTELELRPDKVITLLIEELRKRMDQIEEPAYSDIMKSLKECRDTVKAHCFYETENEQ